MMTRVPFNAVIIINKHLYVCYIYVAVIISFSYSHSYRFYCMNSVRLPLAIVRCEVCTSQQTAAYAYSIS